MGILVDHPDDVEVTLNQEGDQTSEVTPEEPSSVATEEKAIPDKFKGKSADEIVDMYTNLESQYGRLTNELGEYRQMTDRFLSLEEKRMSDLGKTEQDDEFHIDPTELLANPEKVLDEYYSRRVKSDPERQAELERIARLEGQVSQNVLQERHADAAEVAGSPEFISWVRENGYRTRIAQNALQTQDTEALDYLLTEFKQDRGNVAETATPKQSETEAARRVSTESSSTGSAVNTGKRFSRRKLVELKVNNPEEYSARSQEILLAYAQGRVDD